LASQVHIRAAGIEQQGARFALEPAHHGAAHHAMLTGDPDKLIGQIEKHCPLILLVGSDGTPPSRDERTGWKQAGVAR
jgi:hypothetical protein